MVVRFANYNEVQYICIYMCLDLLMLRHIIWVLLIPTYNYFVRQLHEWEILWFLDSILAREGCHNSWSPCWWPTDRREFPIPGGIRQMWGILLRSWRKLRNRGFSLYLGGRRFVVVWVHPCIELISRMGIWCSTNTIDMRVGPDMKQHRNHTNTPANPWFIYII